MFVSAALGLSELFARIAITATLALIRGLARLARRAAA